MPVAGRAFHSLLKYCGPISYKKELFDEKMESIYNEELSRCQGLFRPVGVISADIIMTKIPQATSAGFNFPGKKKGEVLEEAYDNVMGMIESWKQGEDVEQIPCKLALRGHLSPINENKTRCVWVAPIENVVLENMLFRGFYSQISSCNNLNRFFFTGRGTIQRLHEYLTDAPEQSFVNTDISGWDSLRCRFVLKDIFYSVLRPLMQLTEPWMEKAFEYIVDSFIHTHILLPSGVIISKTSGVPSGSFLTLLINSLAVHCVMTSCAKYISIPLHDTRVLGDDFCFKLNKIPQEQLDLLVSDLSACAFEFFSLVVKPEKVIATNDSQARKFIGYQVKNGALFREDRDLLLGMLHPESPVNDLSLSFTRVFAFMVIGGFGSPLVSRFYERYLGGYKQALDAYGNKLFDPDIMRHGNLRVFKHVFHVDLGNFEGLYVDDFRKLFADKAKFFLTFGSRFLFA